MEPWRSTERVQERRLWSTLAATGSILVFALLGSILLTALGSDRDPPTGFYLQQAVLLALSIGGTVVALRRRWKLRVHVEDTSRY